jgi:hypothetical protein
MAVREPLRVRVTDERHANGLAEELIGVDDVSVQHDGGDGWEVVVDCTLTDRIVVRVLDGLRRTLAGDPTASALLLMDGREYQLQGE